MLLPARTTVLLFAVVAQLAGTGCADEPPPTRDEVIHACGILNLETCTAFGRCLGWDAAELRACIDRENAECAGDLQEETCWENQRAALDRCAADVADDSCAALCGDDGFCFAPCSYSCP